MNYLSQINQELEDFQTKQITVVPGFVSSQYDTIQKIYLYHNSKYITGETDDEGDRKYFYNINRNPCKVFSKAVDFDTKNIRLLTVEGGDSLKTWFMERDLKFWMRDKQFGKVLNRLFMELPIYGSVVLKVIKGTPHFVDLRNFVVEQSADSLSQSNYIIETHNYTVGEFRKVAKEMGWAKSKVEETIKKFREMKKATHIKLYERYGEIEETNEGESSYSYRRIFHADVGDDEYDEHGTFISAHTGVELDSKEWDELPYYEFHAGKIPGRWLGVGVVEELFEPQIAENQNTNLQNKTAFWAAMRVFQTRDGAVNRNMMTDVRNGEIMNVDSEITQIDMSDRNLAFFNQQDIKWLKNRDELTFSYDVVQGERLPAGTPLGSAKIAISQTLSYFEQIQENIAMDVKEMLYDSIIPSFEEESTQEHTIRLVGQDLDQYIQMVKNDLVAKEVIRLLISGKFLTNEDRDVIGIAIEESIKKEKEKLLKIPKNFYKNIKYDVDIDITGESVDTRVRYATRFAILQAISADPTMTQDPIKKKILFGMAEDGGINPHELFGVETKKPEEMIPQTGRAGGGVSAPALGASVPGMETMTV